MLSSGGKAPSSPGSCKAGRAEGPCADPSDLGRRLFVILGLRGYIFVYGRRLGTVRKARRQWEPGLRAAPPHQAAIVLVAREGNMTENPESIMLGPRPERPSIGCMTSMSSSDPSSMLSRPSCSVFSKPRPGRWPKLMFKGRAACNSRCPIALVTTSDGKSEPTQVPGGQRQQSIGGLRDRLEGKDVHVLLRQRLAELDQNQRPGRGR